MTQCTPETGDLLEMDLAVALSSARKARAIIEDNADLAEPNDGLALRRVYAILLDIQSATAGAAAVLEQRRSLLAILETAPTERPSPVLRLVK